jgi:hypothetical protein
MRKEDRVLARHVASRTSLPDRVTTPGSLLRDAALQTLSLDRRPTLYDLMAVFTLKKGDCQPLAGSDRAGQRDLPRRGAQRIQ